VERIFAAFTFLYFSDSVIITFSSHYWVHMKKIHFFSGKVVIVTGASSVIGQQLALQLANDGAKLALAARNVQKLEHVARECHQRGAQALVVATDVTQQSQCENLINHTVEAFGCIDTLINNAGITLCARFDEMEDLRVMEQIMRVNYFGSSYCTYYALPYLKKSNGTIVGISSLTGKTGVPTRSFYAASKHAMAGFFDSLRIELADSGVRVTMVYPGFVATEVRKRALGTNSPSCERSTLNEPEVMTAETCAQLILNATAQGKRELVMTFRGRLGLWLKLIAPGLTDRIARRAIATIHKEF
jgi:short-subunit dehydrogenase